MWPMVAHVLPNRLLQPAVPWIPECLSTAASPRSTPRSRSRVPGSLFKILGWKEEVQAVLQESEASG